MAVAASPIPRETLFLDSIYCSFVDCRVAARLAMTVLVGLPRR